MNGKTALDGLLAQLHELREQHYYDRAAIKSCAVRIARLVKAELKERPADVSRLLLLADVQREQGARGKQQAIKLLDQVIALDGPGMADGLQWKGLELLELYRQDFGNPASVTDPADPDALSLIAECLSKGLREPGGTRRAAAEKALEDVRAEAARAVLAVRIQGQIVEGDLDSPLQHDISNCDRAHLLVEKGDRFLGEGRLRSAAEEFERALPLFDNDVQASLAVQRLGKVALLEFLAGGEHAALSRALDRLRASASADPYNQQTQLLLARACVAVDDTNGAIKAIKSATRKSCDAYRSVNDANGLKAWLTAYPELVPLKTTKAFVQFLEKLA